MNTRPEPETLARIERPPPPGKAMMLEELERSFETKAPGKANSSRASGPPPPPGFLPDLELPVKLGLGPGLPQLSVPASPQTVMSQNFLASLGIIGQSKQVSGGSPVASLFLPPPGHPGISKLPQHQPPAQMVNPGGGFNAVPASKPVGFRPFDPLSSHPSPFAAAFNPFNAFGPLGPGLLLPPKSGSPVCESPTVSLTNNSLGLSSPLGVSHLSSL